MSDADECPTGGNQACACGTQHHDLIVSLGDEELHGRCSCGTYLGYISVAQSLDRLGDVWERHVMRPDVVLRSPGRVRS